MSLPSSSSSSSSGSAHSHHTNRMVTPHPTTPSSPIRGSSSSINQETTILDDTWRRRQQQHGQTTNDSEFEIQQHDNKNDDDTSGSSRPHCLQSDSSKIKIIQQNNSNTVSSVTTTTTTTTTTLEPTHTISGNNNNNISSLLFHQRMATAARSISIRQPWRQRKKQPLQPNQRRYLQRYQPQETTTTTTKIVLGQEETSTVTNTSDQQQDRLPYEPPTYHPPTTHPSSPTNNTTKQQPTDNIPTSAPPSQQQQYHLPDSLTNFNEKTNNHCDIMICLYDQFPTPEHTGPIGLEIPYNKSFSSDDDSDDHGNSYDEELARDTADSIGIASVRSISSMSSDFNQEPNKRPLSPSTTTSDAYRPMSPSPSSASFDSHTTITTTSPHSTANAWSTSPAINGHYRHPFHKTNKPRRIKCCRRCRKSLTRQFKKTVCGHHLLTTPPRRLKTMTLFTLVPLWHLIWTHVYSIVERWDVIPSFYFIVQITSTVGFGDIYPVTPLGMGLFPVASLGGITLTAAAVAQIAVYLSTTMTWVTIRNILILFGVVLAMASQLFMYLEDWTWHQSAFFLYSCASTTGLGEEVPKSDAGRLAFCGLMLVFFSLFTTLIKLIVDHWRMGSDAEVVDEREMARYRFKRWLNRIFDD